MKRILITSDGQREIDIDPEAVTVHSLETGTNIALLDGRVIRVTHAGSQLLVNGKAMQLQLADPRNRRRSADAAGESGRRDIRSAMPGKVIRVLVVAGQLVEPGAGLCILEAMKMQNEVRSPGTGRIAAVAVKEGDTVASGQVLVTLE